MPRSTAGPVPAPGQLARANALVLEQGQPSTEEPSELTEGLKNLDDDDWKKKNLYD